MADKYNHYHCTDKMLYFSQLGVSFSNNLGQLKCIWLKTHSLLNMQFFFKAKLSILEVEIIELLTFQIYF